MTELWKDIEGYEGQYQVSNLGRVRSVDHVTPNEFKGTTVEKLWKGRILKLRMHKCGYWIVGVRQNKRRKNYFVHCLVAHAFVPGYFEGAQVNHKDENKLNNRWDNLEWVTRIENCNYGTRNERCNEWGKNNLWISIEQYDTEGNFISSYRSVKAASEATGIAKSSIHFAMERQRFTHGYLFKRKTN